MLRAEELERKITDRSASVGVVGLGYVGLPLVRAFHQGGFRITGFDIDPSKVRALNEGRSYIGSVEGHTVLEMVASGRFRATADFDELSALDAILICVPTPLTRTREPDLSHVVNTSREIGARLRPGQLVVLESTTYPRTTEELILPVLEETGLRSGEDFFLAFSPEREDPGNARFTTRSIPKLVGGMDATSGRLASELYRAAVDSVVEVSHARIAEAAKIVENVYRSVNIAMVNELKVLFDRMGIDVWEVIEAAATKPFGYQAFYPGPGLGGHCIPIDPFYLAWKAREYNLTTRFIELAGEINHSMPHFVVQKVAAALNERQKTVNGSHGLIIGVAYKKNTADCRESPAFLVMELLRELGGAISYYDPFVEKLPAMRHYRVEASRAELTGETLEACDYSVIITDHDGIDWDLVVRHSPVVIDTRNATRDVGGERGNIVKA